MIRSSAVYSARQEITRSLNHSDPENTGKALLTGLVYQIRFKDTNPARPCVYWLIAKYSVYPRKCLQGGSKEVCGTHALSVWGKVVSTWPCEVPVNAILINSRWRHRDTPPCEVFTLTRFNATRCPHRPMANVLNTQSTHIWHTRDTQKPLCVWG